MSGEFGHIPPKYKEWAKKIAPKGACNRCVRSIAYWLARAERAGDREVTCTRCAARWNPFKMCLEAVKRRWISPEGWTEIKPEDYHDEV